MQEAYDEMEEMKRDSSDSEEEAATSDGDEENRKKSAYRRRGRNKDRYVCKFEACGQKVKVDHCLCARLILAGSLSVIILGMFYTLWSMDTERLKEGNN